MEPSDRTFVMSYHFLDENGDAILFDNPIGGESPSIHTPASSQHRRATLVKTRSKRKNRTVPLCQLSGWSDNTLVQSVLIAGGLAPTGGSEGESQSIVHLEELPSRYQKGSVKSRITWFGALCLAGVGMFVEAYVIITTGQVKTVWHDNYPECWDGANDQPCPNNIQCCGLFPNTPDSVCSTAEDNIHSNICTAENEYPIGLRCSAQQLGGVSYAEFAGIMGGMLVFGAICDAIGRKRAGSLTALLMIGGIGGMTFYDHGDSATLFLAFSIFFAIFGLGVGGEYPLTATQAAEFHAESAEDALLDDQERRHHRMLVEAAKTARRGETIALVFAMQGIGAVVGSLYLLSLIYFSNQTRAQCDLASSNSRGTDPDALEGIWRTFYFIGMMMVCMLFIFRFLVLEESEGYSSVIARKERREAKLGRDTVKKRWRHLFWFYMPRLVGTGGNWFVWDVTFYGLKLFSGPIFESINPGGDLVVQNGYLLVNNLCALVGYYCAAAVIDRPGIGRKRLQMFSFAVCAIIFTTTAVVFESASTSSIIFLFFASSFFGNFGANVTTYVMAAETYPTELRGTFHGLSAFLGKLGALVATIGFGYLDTMQVFYVCGGCSVVGLLVTYIFSVDLTGVSLAEHDAQLELLYADRLHHYKGKLNANRHLSNFEVWTGRHGEYDSGWVRRFVVQETSFMQTQHEALGEAEPTVGDEDLFGDLSPTNSALAV